MTASQIRQLEIRRLDPFDDQAFDAWHATYFAADSFGRTGAESPWQREEARVENQADLPHRTRLAYAGMVGDAVAVAATMELPHLDNTDHARVGVWTHPDHRRQGHGSAMLAHIEKVALEHGRNILDADACYPYDAPADGAGHPNADFLTHRGFRFGLGDVNRRLDLPVSEELLERLAADAAPHHAAYRLESFVGRVPEEYVDEFTRVNATLLTEAPTGDLDVEPEKPDVEAHTAFEINMERMGRTKYTTLAFAPDGDLAGLTELVTAVHDPGKCYQWGTLVAPAHRGHRLGLALKVANQAFLQQHRDDLVLVSTFNAEVNDHMIGVNEKLGYVPVERCGEFQKRL